METIDKVSHPVKKESVLLENSCCSRCGRQFKSSDEKIEMDDHRCVCATCYNGLAFPELVTRCSE